MCNLQSLVDIMEHFMFDHLYEIIESPVVVSVGAGKKVTRKIDDLTLRLTQNVARNE